MAEIRTFRTREFLHRLQTRVATRLDEITQTRVFAWVALVALAMAVTALTTMTFEQIPSSMQVGAIVQRDIKADRNYEIVDEEATDKKREEAVASVLPVFDFDSGIADSLMTRVKSAFAAGRATMIAAVGDPTRQRATTGVQREKAANGERELAAQAFATALGIPPDAEFMTSLLDDGLNPRTEVAVVEAIRTTLLRPVIADHMTTEFQGTGVVVRTLRKGDVVGSQPGFEERVISDIRELATLEDARGLLAKATPLRALRDERLMRAATALASQVMEPTCLPNRMETTRRQDTAAAGVKNVIMKLNAGEMIVREGERFEPSQIKLIQGILKEKSRGAVHLEFTGTMILVLMLLSLPFLLLKRFFRRVRIERGDDVLMAITGLMVLLIVRFSLALAPAVHEQLFFAIDISALYYMIPVAGGAMMLRMFLGAELSLMFSVVVSLFAGMVVQNDISFVLYNIVTGSVAIITIANVDRRSQIISAGVVTGLAGAVAVLGLHLIAAATVTVPFSVLEVFWSMILAFIGGLGCAIFAMIAAPIVESVSGFTSDIKLLELANLNHPLLRELIVRAPGTYHHSHVVGLLGEAAASAIGANALLVRVGAYYHDIGKLKKPLYFIENVKGGENRHERLTPHMSALIVSAHVKDGYDLAASAKIPRVILEMIPQHHGTRRISFFYDKAKSLEDPEMMKIDPKDFEYPGPKPQTREAAILMLADVAEAAVRALKEKSPSRIEQTVQRVIHDIFNESQLDECDLTLRDLNAISEAFIRTLLGIYHLRIEYMKDMEYERPEGPVPDEPTLRADDLEK